MLAHRQSVAALRTTPLCDFVVESTCSQATLPEDPALSNHSCTLHESGSPPDNTLCLLYPFTPPCRFWRHTVDKTSAHHRSGFVLHTVTRLHWPELHHYYGRICHLTLTRFSNHFLNPVSGRKTPRYSARLPRLLHQLPARYSVLKHCDIADRVSGFALFCTLTAYAQPNQVCLRYVHLTSYGFLPAGAPETPPLASDALAIQIVFPSVGVT